MSNTLNATLDMIGAIIGDIVGSRFEFHNNTTNRNFNLFTKECEFTDDTICTVAIADALLTGKSIQRSLLEWCHRYPHPMGGYGTGFYAWLHSDSPEPYGSFGNGAAMRVSPVAWFWDRMNTVIEAAKETAICTHNHPDGIKGAQATAWAIWHLRTNKDMDMFRTAAQSLYPGFDTKAYPVGVFDGSCQGTVPVAFQIVCQASSFEDAIRRAILQGGDSDTLGAITGSIAEAYWPIPKEMINFALEYLTDEMRDVLCQFSNKCNVIWKL